MKDYNMQSCQWMVCDCFRQPTQDHNVGYVKNIYLQPFVVGWISMQGFNMSDFFSGLVSVSFDLSNKSGLGKSWQIVDLMFTFEDFWFLDGVCIKR